MTELQKLSDNDLVMLCIKSGDKDDRPFIELFQRHKTFVNRILWKYFPSDQDVEDLTQDVFFKVYRSLGQYQGRSSLKTWIFSIATNTAKNEIRSRSSRPDLSDQINYDPALHDIENTDLPHFEGSPIQESMKQAYEQLSRDEKEILQLKDQQELTYPEIANRLGISESAAKMRAKRSRQILKIKYQEIVDEE